MRKKYSISSRLRKKDLERYEITDKNKNAGLIGKLDVCFSNYGKDYFGIIKDVNCSLDELHSIFNEFTNHYRFESKTRFLESRKALKDMVSKYTDNPKKPVYLVSKKLNHHFYIRLTPNQTPEVSIYCYYIQPITAKEQKIRYNVKRKVI